ncbi:hypothetical protein LEMLEM_LOCUS26528 [Lemmus lemmus]
MGLVKDELMPIGLAYQAGRFSQQEPVSLVGWGHTYSNFLGSLWAGAVLRAFLLGSPVPPSGAFSSALGDGDPNPAPPPFRYPLYLRGTVQSGPLSLCSLPVCLGLGSWGVSCPTPDKYLLAAFQKSVERDQQAESRA